MAALALGAAATSAAAAGELKPWSGNATPRLVTQDLAGKPVDLKALEGRVVVVNFWATWCEPCIDELPALLRLKEKLAGRAFDLVSVNYGEFPAKITRYLERAKLSMPVALDTQKEIAQDWKVGGLPMTFVIDAKGEVRYSAFGERAWDEGESLAVIEKLLAEAKRARH
jgi:thiol-disulfide isomerase/thioredoxin